MTPANKRRSRRLRKKLRVAEFQEMGFTYEAELTGPLTGEAENAFMDSFLAEVIEARSLALGGWIGSGFVGCFGRGSVSEQDRELIGAWLAARPEIGAVRLGPLKDAWYPVE